MDRRTPAALLLALAVSVPLTACGSGDDDQASGAATSCESELPSASAPAGVSTDLSVAPEAPCFAADPPADLVTSDAVVGDGAEAVAGSAVEVKYVGAYYETGEEFDSSWSRGDDETLPVTLGTGSVIEGFDQGITGMQVGGRRLVVIPSDLGYGSAGQGPIPGGATLLFVIDLVSVS